MVKMVRMKPRLVEQYKKFGKTPHYFAGSGAMNYLFEGAFKVSYSNRDEIYQVINIDGPTWYINASDVVDMPKDLDNRKVEQYV
jgi:hypothetical protein